MVRSSTKLLRKAPEVVSRYLSDKLCSLSKGSYRERFPPLSRALPGVNHHISISEQEIIHPTKITTLPNGLKIASEDAPGPAACIGLYVNSGSIYETTGESGISHLLERLAFKDTRNRSHAQIVREVELTGGNVGVSTSREQMGYSYHTLKAYLPQAAELLLDCVRNPIFLEREVQRELAKVKEEIGEAARDPEKLLLESLHLAGYTGALAKPLVASEEDSKKINGSLVEKFYSENYTADRMVLSASGVDHQDLMEIAEPLLHDLHTGPMLEVPTSSYVGGELRHKAGSEITHVALAFEVPGGWRQDREAFILTVLQVLMGGGGSFSSGGPGKGMHSHLYLRVLNNYQQIQSFSAFSSLYCDTGLFGIIFTTDPSFASKAVEVAADELTAIATPGEVNELELNRAKNATKSAILMNLESRPIVAHDIGRQILTYGCRKPVEYYLECIDEITTQDITNMAQKLLSTPLTMSCLGDVDSVPSYASVCRFFNDSVFSYASVCRFLKLDKFSVL